MGAGSSKCPWAVLSAQADDLPATTGDEDVSVVKARHLQRGVDDIRAGRLSVDDLVAFAYVDARSVESRRVGTIRVDIVGADHAVGVDAAAGEDDAE